MTDRPVTAGAAKLPPDADVVVLGAGPAGSVAAAMLARRGRRVVVLERAFFPRYSIGESLLPRSNLLLERAGLWDAVVARRYLEKRGALFLRGDARERFCFADGLPGEPPCTFQVPRGDFDQTLATAARAQGADVRFGREVQAIALDGDGATLAVRDVETGDTSELRAAFVLDASGGGRVLERALGLGAPAGLATRAAVFTMVEGDARPGGEHEGDIWICLHPAGAWIWVIPFSDGRTSVGVVAEPEALEGAGATNRDRLSSLLLSAPGAGERLRKAEPVLRTMRLSGWSSSVAKLHGDRWAIAGNAGEFLDPVFSSGVTLALESGSLAAELAHRALSGEPVDWQTEYDDVVRSAVGVFRGFVEGWYRGDVPAIFFARQKVESVRRYVTSILAGHVLDPKNPLVRDTEGNLRRLARVAGDAETR